MSLTIVASQASIVTAIDAFDAGYHRDYALVRGLAAPYLLAPTAANSAPLAIALSEVLYRWGAGTRKAPGVQPAHALQLVLQDPSFHALLVCFSATPLTRLSIPGGRSRAVSGVSPLASSSAVDLNLILVLSEISSRILIGNTNITYPMKVLLLLTGFMPALDSQVRQGLFKAGFSGTNATQFLMPAGVGSLEADKLTRLPFFLGECFTVNSALLVGAAAASHYPLLSTEPGRLFDVLLFMQGSTGVPLLALMPVVRNWYNLP